MKFYSEVKKQTVTLGGTIGIVSDWNVKSFESTWLSNVLQKKYPGAELVDITKVKDTKCCFLIFAGYFDVDESLKVPCPYVVLSYCRDFEENPLPQEFIKNALFFAVRDVSTSDTFDFLPHVSSNLLALYPQKPFIQKDTMKYIKLVWRSLEEIKNKSIKSSLYIDSIPYGFDNVLFPKVRLSLSTFGLITNDPLKIEYSDKVVYERMKDVDLVISADYHTLLLAFHFGVPCIAINTCPAIKCLMADSLLSDYCVDVDKILTLPKYLSLLVTRLSRALNIKKQFEYLNSCRKKVNEWLILLESKILDSVKVLDENVNIYSLNDPVVIDKMLSDSKISDVINETLEKYPHAQKKEILEKMKFDFNKYYEEASTRIKHALEIEKIKEQEKQRKLEKEKLLEEQKLIEQQKLVHREKINESIDLFSSPEDFQGLARSVFINNKLKSIQKNN